MWTLWNFNVRSTIFTVQLFQLLSVIHGISFEDDVTLDYSQKISLEKFKELMDPQVPVDFMKEDLYLLKWLRSNDFNIPQAENRLLKHITWWKDNRMADIDKEDFSDVDENFKYYLDGRDRIGRSFIYIHVKSMDIRKTLIQGKGHRLSRLIDKALQDACTLVRDLGNKYKNITRGHLIANMDGFNVLQQGCIQCVPFLLRMLVHYEEHYPECQDKLILVNSPSTLEPLLQAIRSLLTPQMREGFLIYGTNRRSWMKELSLDFDPSQLPPALGGSKIYKGMEDDYD